MQPNSQFDLFNYLPGQEYQTKIEPYKRELLPFVEKMKALMDENNPVANHEAFRDYTTYCKWPIRQMEYSYFISNLPLRSESPAIDVGSGVTPFPYLLSQRGWETFSTDIESDQIQLLSAYGKAAYGINATHLVEDIRKMSFSDNQFSLVTCVSVIEHLAHSDVPQAISELVRIVKQGGRLIITTDVYPIDHPHIPNGYGAFTAEKIGTIFAPLAKACNVMGTFKDLCERIRRLTMEDLERFWTLHWQPGFWEGTNRGYCAIGMVFDLPASSSCCQGLVTELRQVAL